MLGKLLVVCFIALAAAQFQDSVPEFDENFETYEFEEYSKAEVYCTANGKRPMNFAWYSPSDDPIPRDNARRIFYSYYVNGSFLNILDIQYNDRGLYSCRASNEYGLATKIFNISVVSKFDNVTEDRNFSVSVRKVTDSSVSFSILAPLRVRFIEARFKEAVESTYKVLQWQYSGTRYEIQNLMPSGKYDFKFTANSTEDDDMVYEIKKVVLLPDVPEVIYRGLKDNTLQIEWFRKFDDVRRSTIDKYELSYYTVQMQRGNSWKRDSCAVTIELPSCAGAGYTIANLFSNSYYEIRLRAHTSAGYGKSYRNKIRISKY